MFSNVVGTGTGLQQKQTKNSTHNVVILWCTSAVWYGQARRRRAVWLGPWWLEDRAHDVHPQHADATRQLRRLVVLLLLRHGQVRHGLTALPLRAHAPAVQRRQLELDAYLGRRGFTMSREIILNV